MSKWNDRHHLQRWEETVRSWFNGPNMKDYGLSTAGGVTENPLTGIKRKNSGPLASFCQDCSIQS